MIGKVWSCATGFVTLMLAVMALVFSGSSLAFGAETAVGAQPGTVLTYKDRPDGGASQKVRYQLMPEAQRPDGSVIVGGTCWLRLGSDGGLYCRDINGNDITRTFLKGGKLKKTIEIEPSLHYFPAEGPVEVGMEWGGPYDYTGGTRTTRTCKAEKLETVEVKAGVFDTIKIVCTRVRPGKPDRTEIQWVTLDDRITVQRLQTWTGARVRTELIKIEHNDPASINANMSTGEPLG